MRSEIIATYALCGFANLGSIGIQLGGLSPMAPKRTGDLAEIVLRSLLGGVVTCLMTASVAGMIIFNIHVWVVGWFTLLLKLSEVGHAIIGIWQEAFCLT